MRWTRGTSGENIEDRRGSSGMRRGLPLGIGGLLLLVVLSLVTGQNFLSLLGPAIEQSQVPANGEPAAPAQESPEEAELRDFVTFVLNDTQATWHRLLPDRYQDATLVLFRDATNSGCGFAQAATGPFYCPADRKVYIDLGFYEELNDRFGAPGDFAQAYVLAHEIGHHVQTLLGIESQVRQMQQRRPSAANPLSVRMELQADCFAGVWGHSSAQRDILEAGDVEEGLNAASAIGDDRLQKMSTGRVQPESFTHGSSAQRVEWFQRGMRSGQPAACDTFGGGTS